MALEDVQHLVLLSLAFTARCYWDSSSQLEPWFEEPSMGFGPLALQGGTSIAEISLLNLNHHT